MVNPLSEAKTKIESEQAELKVGRFQVFGADRRAKNRQSQTLAIHSKALKAFEKYLPQMFHEIPSCEKYDENWDRFIEGLRSDCKSEDSYRKALIFVLKCIQKGNESGLWQLDLPTIPLEITRTKLPYDGKWFRKNQACTVFYHQWIENIERYGRVNYSAEVLLADVLFSAIFHSGIQTARTLHLFAKAVASRTGLFSDEQQIWIETELNNAPTNFIDRQGELHSHWRFFPALPTLGLLQRWYRNRTLTFSVPNELEGFEYWLNRHIHQYNAPEITTKQLCSYSQLCVQLHPGVFYPQILSHVASDKFISLGLSHPHWHELHQPCVAQGAQINSITKPAATRTRHKGNSRIDRHSLFLSKLRNSIQEKSSATQKNTRQNTLKALTALQAELSLTEVEQILLGWLYHCIAVNKNQPSSLRTYLSRGGMQWLNLCYGENIHSWSSEDFVTKYRALLHEDQSSLCLITNENEDEDPESEPKYSSRADYLAKRIVTLHKYGVRHHGLEPLSEGLIDGIREKPHIRAGYISEPLFRYMLNVVACFATFTTREKRKLECIAIIAFRTGLRLGELIKLRVADVEQSDEMWLYVRTTQLDDTKTDSAHRKIPLAVLLTEEELAIVKRYFRFRSHSQTQSAAALMFPSEAGELIPLSDSDVRSPIQDALNACSNQQWTFHHLRHTAISRLQLLLHRDVLELHSGNRLLGQHLLPWDADRCELIYKAIMSGHPRGDYWAFAQFAGHLSPETTLKSYLHFSDWVSASCIRQAQYEWGFKTRHFFSGVSINQLQSLGWEAGALSYTRCFTEIRTGLQRYIKRINCKPQQLPPVAVPKRPKLDLFAMLEILTALANQEDILPLQTHYQITDDVIKPWGHKIDALKQLKTKRTQHRLFHSSRINDLLPGELRSHAEKEEFSDMVKKARKIYRTNQKELVGWIQYQLMHSNTRNHSLPFRDPEQLKVFIATSLKLVPAGRIRIQIRCSPINEKQWTSGLPAQIDIDKFIDNPNASSALVWIKHPDEAGILQRQVIKNEGIQKFKRYSSPVLFYLAYTIALTLFSVEQLQSWSKNNTLSANV